MNILAFDNATSTCSVALQCDTQVFQRSENAPKQQAKLILPMIETVLNDASLRLQDIDVVVFGGGPGSFTGIRIACSVAQGLGFATGVPLVRLSSLAGMAQAVFMEDPGADQVIVAVDARVSQIYWGVYAAFPLRLAENDLEEQLCRPDEVKIPVQSTHSWLGVGDAWKHYPALTERFPKIAVKEPRTTVAEALLVLATPQIKDKNWTPPNDALPVYLR